ncbi:MAG: chemotaxis protein CheW [Blastocatellia bacterium]
MSEDLHLVTFRVGTELFGVPIAAVQEIVRVPAIAHIPHAPDFVEGVINLRGRVITVVDMRKRLNQSAKERDKKSRILVIESASDSGKRLVGVIVDEVTQVIKLPTDRVDPAPPMVAGLSNQYINGVGKLTDDLLILIDIERILTAEQAAALDQVQTAAA